MSTVILYQSSDVGAPVLLNNDSSGVGLINLLNACLVTGYGSLPAAGWSAPYTGTGVTVFKQGTPSNGMYLRVAAATGLQDGSYGSWVTGAPTATDTALASLTNPFPLVSQISTGGLVWLIGASSPPASASSWRIVADSSFFHLELQTNMTNPWYRQHYMFGDLIPSSGVSDPTGTVLAGIFATTPTANNSYTGFNYTGGIRWPYSNTTANPGFVIASGYNQQTGCINAGFQANASYVDGSYWARRGLMFPNGIDGGFYMTQVDVFDYGASGTSYTNLRGTIPGLWVPCHDRAIDDLVPLTGTGPLNGKTFISILPGGAQQDSRGVCIQTSNWR